MWKPKHKARAKRVKARERDRDRELAKRPGPQYDVYRENVKRSKGKG